MTKTVKQRQLYALFVGGRWDGEVRPWMWPSTRLQFPYEGEYRLEPRFERTGYVATWVKWEDR